MHATFKIQDQGEYNQGNYLKSYEELPKLNYFLFNFRKCNILDFYNRVNNVRLLHTLL